MLIGSVPADASTDPTMSTLELWGWLSLFVHSGQPQIAGPELSGQPPQEGQGASIRVSFLARNFHSTVEGGSMAQTRTARAADNQLWGKSRRIAFYVAVALSLLSMLITGPLLTLPVAAWLPEATLDAMFGEEGLGIHRVHMVGAALVFWMTIVAMVVQFRHPQRHAAPLWAAAAGW
jgi:hypothetical protein